KRCLGIHNPLALLERREVVCKRLWSGEVRHVREEEQLLVIKGFLQRGQEQPPKESREHAHGQEESRTTGNPARAIGSNPPAWDNDSLNTIATFSFSRRLTLHSHALYKVARRDACAWSGAEPLKERSHVQPIPRPSPMDCHPQDALSQRSGRAHPPRVRSS